VDSLTGISSMAVRSLLLDLAKAYEPRSRQRVDITSVGGVDAARRLREGEAFDFAVLASDAIDALADSGHVDAASRIDIACSGIAVAIAAGAEKFDASSEAALRHAVLHAPTIGYSTGPSGAHVMRVLAHWGIAETIEPRLVQAPPGVGVGELIASGTVALGFQQRSELMHVADIEIVGALPPSIQATTVFAAAACSSTKHAQRVAALLEFLASDETAETKRRQGLAPAARTG
jgi:molybdate transport system substrate-binding protein